MSARSAADLYGDDFVAWTRLQAKELRRFARTGPNLPLDFAHIAEEIADLGKSQRDSLRNWARRIIEHLLSIDHSPTGESRRRWIGEIVDLRREIEHRLTPTLHRDLKRELPVLYDRARRDLRTKLTLYGEAEMVERLSADCPYTIDQVLGDFWPPPQRDRERRSWRWSPAARNAGTGVARRA